MTSLQKKMFLGVLIVAILAPVSAAAQLRQCREFGKTLVHGRVVCDNQEPVPGCEVVLEALKGNKLIERLVVVTDQNGVYKGCLPCPDNTFSREWLIRVTTCCKSTWQTKLKDCPPDVQVPPMTCQNCAKPDEAPCPPGHTLVLGSVFCSNGEPIPDCPVEILLKDPRDPNFAKTIVTTTDSCGTYRECIPCPPRGTTYHMFVVAKCCDERVGPIEITDDCRPVTPLRGIICSNCGDPRPCAGTQLVGQVVCDDNSPVRGCDVAIQFLNTPRPLPPIMVRTNDDGWYHACLPCPHKDDPQTQTTVLVEALCCGVSTTVTFDRCPPRIEAGLMVCPCDPRPCPDKHTEIKGRVLCSERDPNMPPQPIPDCPIHVVVFSLGTQQVLLEADLVTDREGVYSLCIPCGAQGVKIVVIPKCCGEEHRFIQQDCPPKHRLPDILCDCGQNQPCPAKHTLARGRVMCADLDPTRPVPAPGCPVNVKVVSLGQVIFEQEVLTDGQGFYELCVPCKPDGVEVFVTAKCCGGTFETFLRDCPLRVDFPDIICDCNQQPGPCPDRHTEVHGRILCSGPDPNLPPEPPVDCVVNVKVLDPATNRVIFETDVPTEPGGFFTLCVPCKDTGTTLLITPSCCADTSEYSVPQCPPKFTVGTIVCACAGDPPGPCPQDHTELTGRVLCTGPDPSRSDPPADCTVHVAVIDANTRLTLMEADVPTDPDGYYTLCIPCGSGFVKIHVTPDCCNETRTFTMQGCPETWTLPDFVCDCGGDPPGPCPNPNETLIRGQVLCPGTDPNRYTPVADCPVTVAVEICGQSETYQLTTDAQGFYEVCVPCGAQCDEKLVTVTADCCKDTDPLKASFRACPPEHMLPQLFCTSCR